MDQQNLIILEAVRLPRTGMGLLIGAALGVSGAMMQGLFRNPLADPYLLGTASGASLGVVLMLAAGSLAGPAIDLATVEWLGRFGLVGAALAKGGTGALIWAGLGKTVLFIFLAPVLGFSSVGC